MTQLGQVVEKEVVSTPNATAERVEVSAAPSTPNENRMGRVRRAQSIIWFVCSAVLVTILFRFTLLLLGANSEAGFAAFVYTISYILVAPFLALFGQETIYGASTLEFSDLVAACVYLVVAYGLARLVALVMSPNDPTGASYDD